MDIPIPKVSLPPEQQASPSVVPTSPAQATPVPPEASHPQEVYSLWEQRDEAQVVDSLKGRYLDEYIYSYCKRHKWVDGKRPPECKCSDVIVGLSWVGVCEASRAYGDIQVAIDKVKRRETEDMVEVMVEAMDTKTGSSRIGIACQSKQMRLRSGQVMVDEFCNAKALAKAQRNAVRVLLPITLIKAWIESKVNGQKALPPAAPPPPAIAAEAVKSDGNGNGAKPASPVLPQPAQPANGGSNCNGNGQPATKGYPSVGQVKRIYGLAYGHKVPKEDIPALILRICQVQHPEQIPTRELYEKLCSELERYHDGVPF